MAKVNTDVWDEDMEEYVPATVYVKPCPFCGIDRGDAENNDNWIYVLSLRFVSEVEKYHVYCDLDGVEGPLHLTPEDAVEAWNTRVCCDG